MWFKHTQMFTCVMYTWHVEEKNISLCDLILIWGQLYIQSQWQCAQSFPPKSRQRKTTQRRGRKVCILQSKGHKGMNEDWQALKTRPQICLYSVHYKKYKNLKYKMYIIVLKMKILFIIYRKLMFLHFFNACSSLWE